MTFTQEKDQIRSADFTSEAGEEPLKPLNCRVVSLIPLYPVSAPLGMHARGFWHPRPETAAQMRPLLHVCCTPLTGNEVGKM